jgi:hypothetical protein
MRMTGALRCAIGSREWRQAAAPTQMPWYASMGHQASTEVLDKRRNRSEVVYIRRLSTKA